MINGVFCVKAVYYLNNMYDFFLLFYDNFNSMLMFLYYNNLIYNINGYILYSRNHFKLVLKFVVQKLYNVSYATTK